MKKRLSAVLALILALSAPVLAVQATPIAPEEEGYNVYEVQYILKKFGYFTGELTGYYGDMTAEAVKAFQTDRGLEASGTADEDTVAYLRSAGCTDASVNVKSMLNVREAPDAASEAVDFLTRSSEVVIYSQKDGWYHVETEDGVQGFVPDRYLTAGTLMGIPGKISSDGGVNLRKTPEVDGEVVMQAGDGRELWVVSGRGDWFGVDVDGKLGYIFKKYVNIGGAQTAATMMDPVAAWKGRSTDSLKVRTGPSTGYDVITTLSKDTSFTVSGESGSWYYVLLSGGKKGYVSKDYVAKGSGYSTCTVTDDSLNVRKGAGTNYDVVTTLKKDTVVTLLDDSGDWYKIKTSNGTVGWVDGSHVKLGGSTNNNTAGTSGTAPSGTYKKGSQGSAVTTIQKRLRTLGYLTASATGYYGSATVAAVKAFQSNNSLSASGTCDQKTLTKMFSSSAKKAPSSGGGGGGNNSGGGTKPSGTLGQQIADYALTFLGRPYVYGGNGPKVFDCTGLTKYVYAHFGISLYRTAYDQGYKQGGTKITSISGLQVGDLVFFNTLSDNDLSDHAGIYLGNNKFVHAPRTGLNIMISDMSSGYWKTHFSWGRHVF